VNPRRIKKERGVFKIGHKLGNLARHNLGSVSSSGFMVKIDIGCSPIFDFISVSFAQIIHFFLGV